MKKRLWAFLSLSVIYVGCTSSKIVTTEDLDWGVGVRNPDYVREKVVKILSKKQDDDRRYGIAHGMLLTMDWTQACYVYRTSPAGSDIKVLLAGINLFEGSFHRFIGMTRGQVIETVGQPDDVWDGELVYTGYGSVSDSMSGYIFAFDDEGKVTHVTCAN